MNALKKVAFATLMATTATIGAVANSSEAKAGNNDYFYSYQTEYGYIQFYNYDNQWPIIKKIRYDNNWYRCSFWSHRYSCEEYRHRNNGGGYNGGHNGGYGGGYGGGHSSGY